MKLGIVSGIEEPKDWQSARTKRVMSILGQRRGCGGDMFLGLLCILSEYDSDVAVKSLNIYCHTDVILHDGTEVNHKNLKTREICDSLYNSLMVVSWSEEFSCAQNVRKFVLFD